MIRMTPVTLIAGLVLGLCGTAQAQDAGSQPNWADPPPRVSAVPAPAEQIDAAIGQLDSLAQSMLERSGIPGLAVAVVWKGETVYAKGFGLREVGEAAAVDADTVFQLASVSKSIGATVIAREVGQGLVAWDTPVVEHLPWFALADPWVTQRVTIGDLYAHRSGLPDHAGDELEVLGYDRREALERLRLLPLHPFRSTYAYTNFGLTAAAEAVATAAGQEWATLSQNRLYEPLGMTSTSSRLEDFLARENRAVGHGKSDEGFYPLPTRQPDTQSPAGGVSSSVKDLAKWMVLVLAEGRYEGQQLIEREALLPAIMPHIVSGSPQTPDSRPSLYGYGFGVGIAASGRVTLSHSGAFLMGAATTYLLIPSLDVGIAVLSNAVPIGAVEALAAEFADLVQYGEVTRDWYEAYSGLIAPLLAPQGELAGQAPPADPKPAAPLSAYSGSYGNDYFGDLEIEEREGRLHLIIGPRKLDWTLQHWDGNTFVFSVVDELASPESRFAVAFDADADGNMTSLSVELFEETGWGSFTRH